jgi:hypothetical protein
MSATDRQEVDQWHLARNDKTYGPYGFSTLVEAVRKGVLSADDLVWRPGWDSWRPAGSVPALFASRDVPAPGTTEQNAETRIVGESASTSKAESVAGGRDDVTPPNSEQRGQVSGRRNYFIRHWRGELSLPVSYWLNGFLAVVVASIVSFVFTALIEGGQVRAGAPVAAALVCFMVLLLALSTWQMVGIWRSATRYADKGRKFWGGAAKAAVVIGIARLAIELPVSFVPVVSEHVRIAMGDQQFGASRLRLLRDGTELEFSGGINIGAVDELTRMFDAASDVRVLHLNSPGGRLAEADLMAAEVRKRRLITYVSERCESACTHVFLAGRERWISERAVLGFHQPSFSSLDRETTAGLIENERHRLRSMGLPDAFVSKALDTPSDKMWRPTHEELLAAQVISGVSDGSRFAASGHAASLSPSELEQGILKIPLYASLKRVDPRSFEEIIRQLSEGYRRGVSEEEITSIARTLISKTVRQQLAYASDADVLQSLDILIDYMDGLRSADAESCVAIEDASRGARLKNDLARMFPSIAAKELALNQSIIESRAGERRTIPTDQEVAPYLEKVGSNLARRPELKLDLIDKPKLTPDEFKPFCEAVLAFYQEIRRLPTGEATRVLRKMFADAAK